MRNQITYANPEKTEITFLKKVEWRQTKNRQKLRNLDRFQAMKKITSIENWLHQPFQDYKKSGKEVLKVNREEEIFVRFSSSQYCYIILKLEIEPERWKIAFRRQLRFSLSIKYLHWISNKCSYDKCIINTMGSEIRNDNGNYSDMSFEWTKTYLQARQWCIFSPQVKEINPQDDPEQLS